MRRASATFQRVKRPETANSETTPRPESPTPPTGEKLTPAMRQYWEQKQQAPDAILLFRMGDFYEMFYDDAELGAKVLGITLTSRDRGKTPLAGIPHHALEGYLAKLVAAGYKVAISEQVEDPKEAKGVVQRALVRIVTPGTLTDDGLLEGTRSNVLAALCQHAGETGIATLELSTGQLYVQLCDETRLLDELCRIDPAEVLLAEWQQVGPHPLEPEIRERAGATVTYRPATDFNPHRAEKLLEEQFETRGLIGFGFEKIDASLQAAGALLAYARETQKAVIRHVRPPKRRSADEHLVLDQVTLRSLEVERTLRTGSRADTLLAAVNRTRNPMGARLLRQWLCYPLRDVDTIRRRQRLVEVLRTEDGHRTLLRGSLREMGDMERIAGRLGVQRTNPRDLRALGDALCQLPTMRDALRALRTDESDTLAERLEGLDDLARQLTTVLKPDAPLTVRGGGIFAAGYNAELDRLRAIGGEGQTWLADFQARETKRTGIPSLKVGFNKVFGFYIEITHTHRDRVPPDYVRKQTLKNAERYITDELKKYESEVLSAESRANELEYELFNELRETATGYIARLQQAATALAVVDVLAGWAELSLRDEFCKPEFVDEPVLEIDQGRHPVVAPALQGGFVPNDTRLIAKCGMQSAECGIQNAEGSPEIPHSTFRIPHSPASLALITGPNMAGKSTYIRQVALLTLLAHCGCWVPAKRMRLGVVDRIFTRVGASDELARGQSTFMVEMLEAANILHNATHRSLVILDEIGRGTSTYDGLSLAWAITEFLAQRAGCRALFATHYHELTELGELLDGVFNLNVAVREYEDQVVFLHRIVPGPAHRSYGLHVARLAGLPREAIERANAVLNELEKTFGRESQRPVLAAVQRRRTRQLRLFEEPEETVVRQLRELSSEPIEPSDALELIVKWRRLLGINGIDDCRSTVED
ncbi:MAG: DNA mismatch repair protein MutS [Planctomycetes bacterium]|nr:DNA mismatch repair protein MutS [Planctomycetota bacterium]